MGDFTLMGRPAMDSERGNAPIRLEKDNHNRWVIMLNDGTTVLEAILPDDVVDQIAARIVAEPQKPTGLDAQVTFVEYANLGDSAAYIRRPTTYDPSETVGALLERSLEHVYRHHDPGNRIELQIIPESIPKPEPKPEPMKDPWQGLDT